MVRALSKKGILGMTASTVKGAGVQGGVCSTRCCAAAYVVKWSRSHPWEAGLRLGSACPPRRHLGTIASSRGSQHALKPRHVLGSRALLAQCQAPS